MAALCYIMVFTSTKTYLDFEHALGMPGVVYMYGFVGIAGWLFFYFFLPETENRTLEDIETHFSTQKITNIKIQRSAHDLRLRANGRPKVAETQKTGVEAKGGTDNRAFVENCC